jgi:hypothetical protein
MRHGVLIDGPDPPRLAAGDIRVVFLDMRGDQLVFHDLDQPYMPATASAAPDAGNGTPEDRLLAELIADARGNDTALSDFGYVQLAAWCHTQINDYQEPSSGDAIIFKPAMRTLLAEAAASNQTRRQGLAAWVSVVAGVSPGAVEAARALGGLDPLSVRERPGRMLPPTDTVQAGLVGALDASTRHMNRRRTSGPAGRLASMPRGIDAFDYVSFCHTALRSEAARSSVQVRKGIANIIWIMEDERSIPDAAALLDDADPYIRECGVGVLEKIVNHKQPDVPYEDSLKRQPEEVRRWKAWWTTYRGTTAPTGKDANPSRQM